MLIETPGQIFIYSRASQCFISTWTHLLLLALHSLFQLTLPWNFNSGILFWFIFFFIIYISLLTFLVHSLRLFFPLLLWTFFFLFEYVCNNCLRLFDRPNIWGLDLVSIDCLFFLVTTFTKLLQRKHFLSFFFSISRDFFLIECWIYGKYVC